MSWLTLEIHRRTGKLLDVFAPAALPKFPKHCGNSGVATDSHNMALISCPECNREVSDSATVCPGCGFPLAKNRQGPAEGAGGAGTVVLWAIGGLLAAPATLGAVNWRAQPVYLALMLAVGFVVLAIQHQYRFLNLINRRGLAAFLVVYLVVGLLIIRYDVF